MKRKQAQEPILPHKDAEFSAALTPDLTDGGHSLPHPARMLAARMDHIPGTRPETKAPHAQE